MPGTQKAADPKGYSVRLHSSCFVLACVLDRQSVTNTLFVGPSVSDTAVHHSFSSILAAGSIALQGSARDDSFEL